MAVDRGVGYSSEGLLHRISARKAIWRVFIYAVLFIGAAVALFPFVWLVRSSFMEMRQIFIIPPEWIPRPFVWRNYVEAMTVVPFGLYFTNTIKIVVGVMCGTLLSSSLAAFSFSRLRWRGRDVIFGILLTTMMLPYAVTLVPTFILWSRLSLVNTFVPLTLPAWFGPPFYIFLLRQFFMSIPYELDEAAYVDGASPLYVYWRVILPLAKPPLIVVGIFSFLGVWNDLLGPVIYLTNPDKFTVAVGLAQFRGMYSAQWHLLMAASTVVLLPVIVLFFIAQKYFIEGIALTGLKA
ncbi:MAG: carbohydrate ABC transporter permease [Limnochordia bacterium]|jgi:multiple sugar transport system permease protein